MYLFTYQRLSTFCFVAGEAGESHSVSFKLPIFNILIVIIIIKLISCSFIDFDRRFSYLCWC